MTRIITAGPHTAAEPMIGIRESSAVTTPHRTGEGRPRTQKARLARDPSATHTARQSYILATIELLIPLWERTASYCEICPRHLPLRPFLPDT